MMGQTETLARLVKKLGDARIPYMISGSLASSLHGEPRATNDIDVIISPTAAQLENFLQSLGDDYYASPDAAQEALRYRRIFNIIDQQTGIKADLVIRKDRPFSREEFTRRKPVELLGIKVFVLTSEDAILSKLEWSKSGESERQFRDALGVAAVQWENLDRDYLRKWARELNVEELLDRLLDKAARLQP